MCVCWAENIVGMGKTMDVKRILVGQLLGKRLYEGPRER